MTRWCEWEKKKLLLQVTEILGLFVTATHTTSCVLVNVKQLDLQLNEVTNMEWFLICRVCWFSLYKYSHHVWFQATRVIFFNIKLRRNAKQWLLWACVNLLQPTNVHNLPWLIYSAIYNTDWVCWESSHSVTWSHTLNKAWITPPSCLHLLIILACDLNV